MMPKGVEHSFKADLLVLDEFVKIPMMPKGVEHDVLQEKIQAVLA